MANSQSPTIRVVIMENDDGKQMVHDIIEHEAPGAIEGSSSFTALSKDAKRRALLVALAKDIDRLLDGTISEVRMVRFPTT